MKKNNFWFFSLIALMTIASNVGWTLSLRMAVVLNGSIILYHCVSTLVGAAFDCKKLNEK